MALIDVDKREIQATPLVLQYNKRGLPNILSVDTLDAYLNPMRLPRFASTVWRLNEEGSLQSCGEGVLETFNTITALVLDKLRREHGESGR